MILKDKKRLIAIVVIIESIFILLSAEKFGIVSQSCSDNQAQVSFDVEQALYEWFNEKQDTETSCNIVPDLLQPEFNLDSDAEESEESCRTEAFLQIPKQLQEQEKSEVPKKKKKYLNNLLKCHYCNRSFHDEVVFKKHEELPHVKEGLYLCRYCNEIFSTLFTKQSHEKNHEKNYKCLYCPEIFNRSDLRVTHERGHTGEKPYKCAHCNKFFFTSSNKTTHELIKHTNKRSHKCSKCDAAFKLKGDLINHERIHSNEKPYTCEFCQKGFKTSSNARRHEKTCKRKDCVK